MPAGRTAAVVLASWCITAVLGANPNVTSDLLWPLPSSATFGTGYFSLDPSSFQFVPAGPGGASQLLQAALQRYLRLVFHSPPPFYPGGDPGTALGVLPAVYLEVSSANETLGPDTNEKCEPLPLLVYPDIVVVHQCIGVCSELCCCCVCLMQMIC